MRTNTGHKKTTTCRHMAVKRLSDLYPHYSEGMPNQHRGVNPHSELNLRFRDQYLYKGTRLPAYTHGQLGTNGLGLSRIYGRNQLSPPHPLDSLDTQETS